MIKNVQTILRKITEFQLRHLYIFLIIYILLTAVAAYGVTKIEFQSDLSKSNPKDIPSVILDEKVNKIFSESGSTIVVLVEIDEGFDGKNGITDIRDPRVIIFLKTLEQNLIENEKVMRVMSAGDLFPDKDPQSIDEIKIRMSMYPQSSKVVNKAYSLTAVFITTTLSGADEEKVREITAEIDKTIYSSSIPSGIKVSLTGEPPLAVSIFRLLINDALLTLLAAAVLIFILLFLLERSVTKSIAIMLPLVVGLTWTLGAMGLLSIPISIGTAGISAMLLGLGVEYSIFIFSRYDQERSKHNTNGAIAIALSTTGASTMSSGLTAVIGFGALITSTFPMLGDMGMALAMGIFLILSSILLVSPLVILGEHKLFSEKRKKETKETKTEIFFEKYGALVVKRAWLFIIIPLLITAFLFTYISKIESQDIDFNTVLPSDLAELRAFNKITYELGDSENLLVFIHTEPLSSDLVGDIRSVEYAKYIYTLGNMLKQVEYVEGIESYPELSKTYFGKEYESTLALQKARLESIDTSSIISEDSSSTLIRVSLNKDALANRARVVQEVNQVLEETDIPAGIEADITGNLVLQDEFDKVLGPDTAKTAIVAFVLIIILLLILSRSIKYTILPILTVVFGLIVTMGIIGLFKIPFSSISSSVLAITIGVGIDFGLQLSMRYVQEREHNDKKKAMIDTLKYTLYPLTITLVAALIGFRAMSLGQLKIMANLGTVVSIGMAASMFIAVTLVVSLIYVLDREGNKSLNNERKSK